MTSSDHDREKLEQEVRRLRWMVAEYRSLLSSGTALPAADERPIHQYASVELDREHVIVAVSEFARRWSDVVFGTPLTVGQPIAAVLGEENYRRFTERAARAFAGETIGSDRSFTDRSGNTQHVHFVYSPVQDGSGDITRILMSGYDRTELVNAERERDRSLRKFRLLFETAPVMMHSIAEDGRILAVSDLWLETLGYEREEVLGRTSVSFLTPESQLFAQTMMPQFFREGSARDIPYRFMHKNGSVLDILVNATMLRDEEGELLGIIGVLTDITQQRRTREALSESERRFQLLFESLIEGIVTSDTDGTLLMANPAAAAILGYADPSELLQVNGYDLFTSETEARRFYFGLDEQNGLLDVEARLRRKDGSLIPVQGSASLYDDTRTGRRIIQTIFTDVSEKKQAELSLQANQEKLREANATKNTFFSIIAHDLKNPFTSILGYTDILYKEYDRYSDDQKKHFIRNVWRSAHNTYRLVENLLQWASTQTDLLVFSPARFDIGTLVSSTLSLLHDSAVAKNISIYSSVEFGTMVYADEDALTTVLRNLITNAIKFTTDGGNVMVSAEPRGDMLVLQVKDTGIGIPEDMMEALFRIDVKFKRKGTAEEEGSGLGLILCKEFIEQNGGSIAATSTPGEGSTFSITIPMKAPAEDAGAEGGEAEGAV